jgi:hypothetical protein
MTTVDEVRVFRGNLWVRKGYASLPPVSPALYPSTTLYPSLTVYPAGPAGP